MISPGDDSNLLGAKDIVVSFEGLLAIDGVSILLRQDQILGLIGPNGAGKTTLVNVLTGFQRPTSGRIYLSGEDVTNRQPHHLTRNGIARSFQNVRLFKECSVLENLEVSAVGVGLGRRQAHDRAMQILEWIGLEDKASLQADTLPYGDERRVGIARALATHPRFLLLDEPAAGLSDAECDVLMDTIAQIPGIFGCGVLIVEHNMRVIMHACGRIHVIDFGKTIAEGTPQEIQGDPIVIRAYLGAKEK